jgi:HAD superfamily hydrolase (TIGR01484 family)
MQGTHYDQELSRLAQTYAAAMSQNIDALKDAISGASESSIIGVGSGGSYTTASLLCSLHEHYTGRVSRPSTPLEIICNPTLASSSPVFLLSAEGKNPDIVEALHRARRHSARTIHVLTNRAVSPLTEAIEHLTDVSPHVFELSQKDGYLATNSLLFDSVLFARAYSELNRDHNILPAESSELRVGALTISEWLDGAKQFVDECVKRQAITVVYSPQLKPIAADLESKLSEGALLHSQFADLRSYAHGRHLWLASRPNDCCVLALTESSLDSLWEQMRSKFPHDVPTFAMALGGATPRDLISGLIAQMYLVALIGTAQGKDVGKPEVAAFGKELYYLELRKFIPEPVDSNDTGERSKYDVLGARWPSFPRGESVRRAKEQYIASVERQRFRSIVFDYDGTLCSSHRKDMPPPKLILRQLERLLRAGVAVGIASGRGGSIQEKLAECLPAELLPKLHLGLYNGGALGTAESSTVVSQTTSEFLSHVARIVVRLKSLGVPLQHRVNHPYQVSVRFREGISTKDMWFVIGDALRQDGLDPSRMVRSKHSVDILAEGISKSRLIADIIQKHRIDPYEVLTMGDQGAWPGNDSALLEHRYSLSVDVPSRRLDRGWRIAPSSKRDVDATLWYLDRLHIEDDGYFTMKLHD